MLTDSNGREATANSILNHVPKKWRGDYDVRVIPVYTTEEAFNRVGNGDVDVVNADVIIDVLTNDVRGTRQRSAASPEELVWRVDRLRRRLREAGARETVVCQIKPMEVVDVTAHSVMIHDYLQAEIAKGRTGYGCSTQVRRQFLKRDGYHIQPQYDSLIDRTYACAMLGFPVPEPTPLEELAPEYVRRRYHSDYPSLARRVERGQRVGFEGPRVNYGW